MARMRGHFQRCGHRQRDLARQSDVSNSRIAREFHFRLDSPEPPAGLPHAHYARRVGKRGVRAYY